LGSVSITVAGVCRERVTIDRDDVSLGGEREGDGLESTTASIVEVLSSRRVSLDRLTLVANGARWGLLVSGDSQVVAEDLTIRRPAFVGVLVMDGSRLTLSNSRVSDSTTGLLVEDTASLATFGTEVGGNSTAGADIRGRYYSQGDHFDRNGMGLWVQVGGLARSQGTTITESSWAGVVLVFDATAFLERGRIAGSGGVGIQVSQASRLSLFAMSVESNAATGIAVSGGSLASFSGSPGNEVIIRGNSGDGVTLHDTSVLSGIGFQITANSGHGLSCQGVPSAGQVSGVSIATVFGNSAGQVTGCPGVSLP
jgi:hypothetical protein